VDDKLHQACSSQLSSSLQFTNCIKLHQACSSTTFIKSAVHNFHQACSSQLASSLQFTTCSKAAVHNLKQGCSSQVQLLRLDIIKPEQAIRTHPGIGLTIASFTKSAADLLQLARFLPCTSLT
jgi:hypothetical protein